MKLPRRNFLHVAAGAAGLLVVRVSLSRKPIRRGRCALSPPRLLAARPTLLRGSSDRGSRGGSASNSS
jgi:hypothetical protein